MDNITHSLLGLAAAKAGLERLSPAATAVCIIAANAPDSDILAVFGGRWFYLHHHRGITHSIVGTLALAFLIPILFWLGDRLIARVRARPPSVRFKGLLLASLIVSASHPLLDWTNNYGVRPLLPWSAQWFYGDLVFIMDPLLWLFLGGAAFLLTANSKFKIAAWGILGSVLTFAIVFTPLVRSNAQIPLSIRIFWAVCIAGLVVAHRMNFAKRFGSSVAISALLLVVAYWGGLAILHKMALNRAEEIATRLATEHGEVAVKVAAMPMLANPFRWQGVAATSGATYRYDVALGVSSAGGSQEQMVRYPVLKDEKLEARKIAERDQRAVIFLGFARFPVAIVEGDCFNQMLVQFADLRYTEPARGRSGGFALEVPIDCSQIEER